MLTIIRLILTSALFFAFVSFFRDPKTEGFVDNHAGLGFQRRKRAENYQRHRQKQPLQKH